MKRSLVVHLFAIFLAAAALFVSGWFVAQFTGIDDIMANITADKIAAEAAAAEAEAAAAEAAKKPESISVAIYPYVSDMGVFKQVLYKQWKEIEPNVELQFVEWDCYADPYPNNIDVMTYDALFLSHLVESGYLQPLNTDLISNTYGILPFAMEGSRHNGDLYALPFLACTSCMIYYADDEELAEVDNYNQLIEILTARMAEDPTKGLQTAFQKDAPYLYLDALIDHTGKYTTYDEAPGVNPPDTEIMKQFVNLKSVIVPLEEGEEIRSQFNLGEGTACIDYTEGMYFMPDIADKLTIRTISFSEEENVQMYFTDLASIGSQVTDPVKIEVCTKLINLMASEEFQNELCFGFGEVQYMLPAREQVYKNAMEQYPIYEVLYELVSDPNNKVYRFGPDIYTYLTNAGYTVNFPEQQVTG